MKGSFFSNPECWRIMGEAYDDGWHIRLNTHDEHIGFYMRFSFPFPLDPDKGTYITDEQEKITEQFVRETLPSEDLDYIAGLETMKVQSGQTVRCMIVDVMTPPNQRLLDGLRGVSKKIIDAWQAD